MRIYEESARTSAFLILRDFYGTTQIVIETEEMMEQDWHGVNTESTISVTGVVRGALQQERRASDR